MRCCRNDWPGLCVLCVINSRLLSANRVELGFVLFHKFFNFTPLPSVYSGARKEELTRREKKVDKMDRIHSSKLLREYGSWDFVSALDVVEATVVMTTQDSLCIFIMYNNWRKDEIPTESKSWGFHQHCGQWFMLETPNNCVLVYGFQIIVLMFFSSKFPSFCFPCIYTPTDPARPSVTSIISAIKLLENWGVFHRYLNFTPIIGFFF